MLKSSWDEYAARTRLWGTIWFVAYDHSGRIYRLMHERRLTGETGGQQIFRKYDVAPAWWVIV